MGIPSVKLFTVYRDMFMASTADILGVLHALSGSGIAAVHAENAPIVENLTAARAAGGTVAAQRPPASEPTPTWWCSEPAVDWLVRTGELHMATDYIPFEVLRRAAGRRRSFAWRRPRRWRHLFRAAGRGSLSRAPSTRPC